MKTEVRTMNDKPVCPFNGQCPHLACIKNELNKVEEETHEDIRDLAKSMNDMRRTLYIIAGILFAELGVMIV